MLYGRIPIASLAGNFLVIANLSNLIIVECPAARGIGLGRGEFASTGMPLAPAHHA